jgi:hypothetical protein
VWSCLVYGPPALGDERILLRLDPDGSSGIRYSADSSSWIPLSQWERRGGRLEFQDRRTGRRYEAGLDYPTLGGTWQTESLQGGWWCSGYDGDSAAFAEPIPGRETDLMPPLVASLMASPRYPRRAVREATEGHAIVCFIVDSNGRIHEPEFIELSDEIFRATTLRSLERSRYVGWGDTDTVRPGCRTYVYRLDRRF